MYQITYNLRSTKSVPMESDRHQSNAIDIMNQFKINLVTSGSQNLDAKIHQHSTVGTKP